MGRARCLVHREPARDRLTLAHRRGAGLGPCSDTFLEEYKPSPVLGTTVTASSFGATLELAREGYIELRQTQAFGPLYLKWLNKAQDESAA